MTDASSVVLGWTELDVVGVHERAPSHRFKCMELALLTIARTAPNREAAPMWALQEPLTGHHLSRSFLDQRIVAGDNGTR